MLEKTKQEWQHFKESKPGRRFKDRYLRLQGEGYGGLDLRRGLYLSVGIVLTLAGLFFMVAPGPGWIAFLVGLGIIASELWPVARFLDWAEAQSRRLLLQALKLWQDSGAAAKILISLTVVICVVAAGYGTYQLSSDLLGE